jgi:hypothetical protein
MTKSLTFLNSKLKTKVENRGDKIQSFYWPRSLVGSAVTFSDHHSPATNTRERGSIYNIYFVQYLLGFNQTLKCVVRHVGNYGIT